MQFEHVEAELEVLFIHPGRTGGSIVRSFLDACFGRRHRIQYASFPAPYAAAADHTRWIVNRLGRLSDHKIQAYTTNLFLDPHRVGPTRRPVALVTCLRDPIARICSEHIQLRASHGPRDVATFAERFARNDLYTRVFAGVDLDREPGEADLERASARLREARVVAFLDQPHALARELAALPLTVEPETRERATGEILASFREKTAGEQLADSLDPETRQRLLTRNLLDAELVRRLRQDRGLRP